MAILYGLFGLGCFRDMPEITANIYAVYFMSVHFCICNAVAYGTHTFTLQFIRQTIFSKYIYSSFYSAFI